MNFQRNVLLKNHTTFKIGGPAEYFFVAKKKEDLIEAVKFAKKNKLKITVLGGGSNLLVCDKGIKGLVVKIENKKIEAEKDLVFAKAGTRLESLVSFCTENNLQGLEWSSGIPGITVGGAVYGNAQAFGTKISDSIKNIEAIDIKTLKIKNLSNKQCRFRLKNSIFKKNKNLIIISASFLLEKGDKKEIKAKIKEYINYRKKRHPINFPSAGSVFVNPEIIIKNKKLLEKFPELNEFNKRGVIHAGYLIEKSGLKGKKIGKAQISEKHSNFIINLGGAKAKDVLKLITLAKQKVKKTFGIDLVQEVQLMGFNN
ncbi:MAG: UDP-N-acetylmuramate dehydrogenase [bacterium]|nr:UDP-N-acetylmuramate dehydrogenase [bacterium]